MQIRGDMDQIESCRIEHRQNKEWRDAERKTSKRKQCHRQRVWFFASGEPFRAGRKQFPKSGRPNLCDPWRVLWSRDSRGRIAAADEVAAAVRRCSCGAPVSGALCPACGARISGAP